MMPYNHTKFRVKTHQGVGSVGKKVMKILKIWNSSARAREGGTGVGDHLGTCPPISISIDGTSPKFLWWTALLKVYKPTKCWGKTYQGAGSAGKKVLEILKKS